MPSGGKEHGHDGPTVHDEAGKVTVFVAGGSGTIGRPLVRALVAAGHHVVAMTRSSARQAQIAQLGATPVAADALDAVAVERVVRATSPTHLVHQLTALPWPVPAARIPTARRCEGIERAVRAVQSMEEQVLAASRRGAIEGIVLRYGLFYGTGTPSTDQMIALARKRRLPTLMNDRGRLPFIHLADAVTATVAALHSGVSTGVYHIVDDQPASMSEMVREMAALTGAPQPFAIPRWLSQLTQPYLARMLSLDLSLPNADARRDLGWSPRFPSYREGLRNDLLVRN